MVKLLVVKLKEVGAVKTRIKEVIANYLPNERTAYTVDIRKPELMFTGSNLQTTQRSSSWTGAHRGICDEESDCLSWCRHKMKILRPFVIVTLTMAAIRVAPHGL